MQRIYYDSIAWQYPLPQQLSRLASLEVLNVSGINMGGQLPESWAALRNLTHLDISSWQMGQRSLPLPWIYNLTSLQVRVMAVCAPRSVRCAQSCCRVNTLGALTAACTRAPAGAARGQCAHCAVAG